MTKVIWKMENETTSKSLPDSLLPDSLLEVMLMTRREILLSACALAGTPARLSAAQSREGIQQSTLESQAPAGAVSLSDFEALARERVPRMAFEYISGGAADEHTSELQSLRHLVCRLLLEKK